MKKFVNILAPLIVAVLVIALAGTIGLAYMKKHKAADSTDADSASADSVLSESTGMNSEKWSEGTISYNGKKYVYNSNLDNYLMMGIDRDEPVEASPDSNSGGQADALFLLSADHETETMRVVAIHRNTMTQIYTCDEEGNATGYVEAQICTQHGFGDGKKLSCKRTVDAVSNLFYGLPIDGYFSLNIGGIEALNSVVGGVEVEVLEDVKFKDVSLTKGETKTLSDREAYYYLHYRDTNVYDSATGRLERQKQYIDKYLEKLKKCVNDKTIKASALYNTVSDYCVTDLPLSDTISTLMNYSYDSSQMYSLKGETTQTGEFEEFYVDDDALYDLIIQLFYTEVQ